MSAVLFPTCLHPRAVVNIGPTTDQRNHTCPDCGAFWTTHPERTPTERTPQRGGDDLMQKWMDRYNEFIRADRTYEAEQVLRCINDLKALSASAARSGDSDAVDAARWRAVIGSARVRHLGSAGLHSDNDPYGNPYGNFAHIGLELWTMHEAGSEPEAVRLFTAYADKAVAALQPAARQGGEG